MPRSPVPRGLRAAVWERDDGRCQRCGVLLYDRACSLHHRRPRRAGGTAVGAHTPENLILLCGTGTTGCHQHVESWRTVAYRDGWLVHTWDDPATVPVLRHDGGWALCGPAWTPAGPPSPSPD